MPSLPTVKSFLIADSVFQQVGGKWCIVGVFDRIWGAKFPATHPSLGIYLELEDVPEGKHEIFMTFSDSENRQLAVSPKIHLTARNRLAKAGVGVQTHNLTIPAAGTYFIEIVFDGQSLPHDIRLEAGVIPKKKGR